MPGKHDLHFGLAVNIYLNSSIINLYHRQSIEMQLPNTKPYLVATGLLTSIYAFPLAIDKSTFSHFIGLLTNLPVQHWKASHTGVTPSLAAAPTISETPPVPETFIS